MPEVQVGGQHIARKADITLQTTDDFQLGYESEFETLGPTDGIGSQDFEELDLGLDFGDGAPAPAPPASSPPHEDDESMEIEFGRDAAPPRPPRESLGSELLGRGDDQMDIDILSHRSREPSEHPFDADMTLELGPDIDLGLDFGDHEQTPRLTPSRACEFNGANRKRPY